jgi:hypothetical protein
MRITAGEKIRLLPIVMNPFHVEEVKGLPKELGEPMMFKGQSGCYIGDLWTPLCYPIRGEYNDYGSIESIPDKTHKDIAELHQFIEAFKRLCLPIGVGENEYHDVAIKKFTLAEILEGLQEGRCFMKYESDLPQYKDRVVPISWMMIKESVWQSLLAIDIKKSNEVWTREGEEDRYSLEGIKKLVTKSMERAQTLHSLETRLETQERPTDASEQLKLAQECLKLLAESTSMAMSMNRLWFWHQSPLDCPELNSDMIDVVAEMEYVHSMLGILRINYAPTTGSGSQCDNYKLWKLVNRSWSKIITEDIRKHKEMYGDE